MNNTLKWKALSISVLMSLSLPVLAASSDSVGTSLNDSLITTKVKSGLAADSATHAMDISVETNNGVVTLSGTAESNTEAATAVQIAESTKDVRNVDASNLKVTGNDGSDNSQPLTDAYITAKVKGMFIKNNLMTDKPNVPVTGISVETNQGVVTLSGTVKHRSQISEATKLAKSVDGVSKVVSNLTVG